jgi:hypothetical protein
MPTGTHAPLMHASTMALSIGAATTAPETTSFFADGASDNSYLIS